MKWVKVAVHVLVDGDADPRDVRDELARDLPDLVEWANQVQDAVYLPSVVEVQVGDYEW